MKARVRPTRAFFFSYDCEETLSIPFATLPYYRRPQNWRMSFSSNTLFEYRIGPAGAVDLSYVLKPYGFTRYLAVGTSWFFPIEEIGDPRIVNYSPYDTGWKEVTNT